MEALLADLPLNVERRDDALRSRERGLPHGRVQIGRRDAEMQILARLSQRLRGLAERELSDEDGRASNGDVLAAHDQRVPVALDRHAERQA